MTRFNNYIIGLSLLVLLFIIIDYLNIVKIILTILLIYSIIYCQYYLLITL